MHAVVMAAGEGSRLRPLTERWPKPVLPIDGRPVIATLLRELASAGCARVVVVTGHLAEQVEELVGDGSAFGLEIVFVRQPGVLGSADTVIRALAAGAEPPLLVTAADTVYTPGDVRRVLDAYAASGAAGALAGRRDPPPVPAHRDGLSIVDGFVRKVVDDDPATELGSAPLWILGPELIRFLDDLSGPPFELADVFKRALESNLPIAGIEIRRTRDLTRPVDLVEENFPYLSHERIDLQPLPERPRAPEAGDARAGDGGAGEGEEA
jgi:NDP-sugar pyrophosphorylase family protein